MSRMILPPYDPLLSIVDESQLHRIWTQFLGSCKHYWFDPSSRFGTHGKRSKVYRLSCLTRLFEDTLGNWITYAKRRAFLTLLGFFRTYEASLQWPIESSINEVNANLSQLKKFYLSYSWPYQESCFTTQLHRCNTIKTSEDRNSSEIILKGCWVSCLRWEPRHHHGWQRRGH